MPELDDKPQVDDPVSSTTMMIGVAGAIVVFVIGVLLQAMYLGAVDSERQKKVLSLEPEELRAVRGEQREVLGGYRWIDKEQQIVAIPIDRAIDLVADEYARRQGEPR